MSRIRDWRAAAARVGAVTLATLLTAACGAGGSDLLGGVGSGGTGAAAFGPISGFGSVIVNGVRFDESGADVFDDDGRRLSAGDLALGMVVEVRGRIDANGSDGSADTITAISELRGPIDAGSLDVAGARFSVLGIEVRVDARTVFDDASGLAALAPGVQVEVYGVADRGAGNVRATRVERKPANTRLVLRGSARSVAGDRFVIGPPARPLLVEIGAARREPAGAALLDGGWVRIETDALPLGGVLRLGAQDRLRIESRLHALDPGTRMELEGVIDEVATPGSFTLLGIPVDASAARFDDGTSADVAPGARVEVEGEFRDGTLVASRVEFTERVGSDDTEFEVRGLIAAVTGPGRFSVRGVMIDATGPGVQMRGGGMADLLVGREVKVKGSIRGDTLVAARLEFED